MNPDGIYTTPLIFHPVYGPVLLFGLFLFMAGAAALYATAETGWKRIPPILLTLLLLYLALRLFGFLTP